MRKFGTFTPDLEQLADWLKACGLETVAMESTGVYWIPIFELLEARGFKVHLVNAQHLKNVPGRKSDVQDCQWIQQLHGFGLLSGSFRPEAEMCALRAYVRHRAKRCDLSLFQLGLRLLDYLLNEGKRIPVSFQLAE